MSEAIERSKKKNVKLNLCPWNTPENETKRQYVANGK